jgi:D-arabinose 1-dehydrogenase-like Zn-dependent alcohol dehydrogenase
MQGVVKAEPVPGVRLSRDLSEPVPENGEVLVKVAATSICGTDLELYEWSESARGFDPKLPFVMGHECSGTVVAVGPEVGGLLVGDRVAAESHIFCGRCYLCRTGKAHNCERLRVLGITWDGAFAELVKLPASVCFRLPEPISPEIGALFEPAGVAVHALQRAGSVAGCDVLVCGCGPIGLVVVQLARASNLVEDDFNVEADIFVHNLQSNTTQLVSIDSSGNQANDYSFYPSISADGRYVAFGSPATNLVTGDTNDQPDVFVRDRTEGITQRVNLDSCGAQANSGEYLSPDISPDGRYVAFTSGFPNQGRGGFVRDLQSQTTQSVDGGGGSLSADARFIAFFSSAPLTADDTNGFSDIFVHERHTVTTQPSDCIAPTSTASATTSSGAAYEQGTWTNKDVKVTFSAQDNADGSGLKEIRYVAEGAQSLPRTVYDPQNPPIINTDGMTRITYAATDNAGNRESGKTFTVMVDKTAPDTEIVSGPCGFVSNTSASFSVSKAASEDGWIVTFQCRLDGGTFATCPQHKSYSSLSQGTHTFEARTVDKAGNIDASPASRSWFVDTVAPKGTVSINGGAASTRNQSVALSLSTSDRSPASGVALVRLRNENTATWSEWLPYSSSAPWQLSNGAGTKTVYAQFKDRAGNVSATAYDKIKYSP